MQGYTTRLKAGAHWSLKLRRGVQLTMTDLHGGANVGMVFFNPENLFERYNAPDTLKAQHTFKINQGHCLYSDMGRIFASVIEDTHGWHDTVCGNSHAEHIRAQYGARNYQRDRNNWHQNGYDAFLVEAEKYGLGPDALPANLNWFSRVESDDMGAIRLVNDQVQPGHKVTLRFEMDTLVLLHTCPHPLAQSGQYPSGEVQLELTRAAPRQADDLCENLCPENQRGFMNNALYHFGLEEAL